MLTQTQTNNVQVQYKEHTNCRICNSHRLTPYLDLGSLPLSNNLAISQTDPIHNQVYPLKVLLCENCGLSQLSIVIDPVTLFGHYVYRSSISQGYVDHCRKMAIDLQKKYNLTSESYHIDIAGNDGALLQQFREVIGHNVLNIDPAANMKAICSAANINTLTYFWGIDVARRILNGGAGYGQADLITATNVFAHVNDVKEFIDAVKLVLKPTGVLVMEFPYLVNFIEGGEFDTIYFEHLSYFSIYPLSLLCRDAGLTIMNVSEQEIHGGSVRVTIGYGYQDGTAQVFINNERRNYSDIQRYYRFAEDVHITIGNFWEGLQRLDNVAGFAASAKGNTLLNCANISPAAMRFIVDETPEKIGKYSPGTRIPIVSMKDMMRTPPDYLVVLSWNFASEIVAKCRQTGYKGKFIIPIPDFKIIE